MIKFFKKYKYISLVTAALVVAVIGGALAHKAAISNTKVLMDQESSEMREMVREAMQRLEDMGWRVKRL